jgi:hypothetical protein
VLGAEKMLFLDEFEILLETLKGAWKRREPVLDNGLLVRAELESR